MKAESVEQLEPVWAALSARTGLRLAGTRIDARNPVYAKLLSRLRAVGMTQLLSDLGHESPLLDELLDEVTVRETYFFRDVSQFKFIRTQIIPELLARCGSEHVLKCWSAACASGEEAYSLAILMREAGLEGRCQIMGSDISFAALAQARRGKYRDWSLRGEGATMARRYFTGAGESHVIDDSIRRLVTFERLNLAQDMDPSTTSRVGAMDLILCRNVLIYFDAATIAAVARRLFDSLAEGGWLLTGATDPMLMEYAPFEVAAGDAGLAYRRPRRGPKAQTRPADEKRIAPEPPHSYALNADSTIVDTVSPAPPDRSARARAAFAAGNYATTVALTRELVDLRAGCVLHLRALANLGDKGAAAFAERAIERHPLCAELYYVKASLQIIAGESAQAIAMLRKAIYLEPSLAAAHFTLGSLLQQSGDLAGAQRSLRNAIALTGTQPAGEFALLDRGELSALPASGGK